MDRATIRNALLDALHAIAPEVASADIAGDRPLRDQVELDSMDFLNFLIRVHDKLGVDVPEADAARLVTLDDFVACVETRLR